MVVGFGKGVVGIGVLSLRILWVVGEVLDTDFRGSYPAVAASSAVRSYPGQLDWRVDMKPLDGPAAGWVEVVKVGYHIEDCFVFAVV